MERIREIMWRDFFHNIYWLLCPNICLWLVRFNCVPGGYGWPYCTPRRIMEHLPYSSPSRGFHTHLWAKGTILMLKMWTFSFYDINLIHLWCTLVRRLLRCDVLFATLYVVNQKFQPKFLCDNMLLEAKGAGKHNRMSAFFDLIHPSSKYIIVMSYIVEGVQP